MASPGVLPSFEFNATYVHSLRQRDPATEEHFVSHFSPMLLRKLRKKLHCTDLAHDLRQETFLRVLTFIRSDHSIREPERFEFFVIGVCNNVLRETYRQQKKLVPLDPEFDMASNARNPHTCAMATETAYRMQRMLSNLSPRVRAILEATFLEEQDRDEICLKFGVNRNHLRLLIFRAKRRLGACSKELVPSKTGMRLRRSAAPRRRATIQDRSPRPVMERIAASRPTNVFLALPTTDRSSAHCCA